MSNQQTEKIKLILKRNERGLFCLFTEDGKCLPNQASVSLSSEPFGAQELTVKFVCDGENIRVIGDPEVDDNGGESSTV
ncbi:hypothetical protein SAMN05216409_13011 [Pseudomonas lutea]|uniref:Uncharacterized protein n=1 Tax=Pseudomonas lutea TaxID=243924 RepID=A0A9X8QM29_9PSED|nr:hypothetical protein SAMN05216409_13011 [Pseudomonas lutea]